MISEPGPEEIERHMALLRSVLRRDVRELASEARTLADWRHHFRNHPWIFCGAAATLGFVLVPRVRRGHSDLSSEDRELVQRAAAMLQARGASAHVRSSVVDDSFLKSLLTLAATALARQAVRLALDRFHAAVTKPPRHELQSADVEGGPI